MTVKNVMGGKTALNTINTSAIKGEPGTGYEGPDLGDFNCYNCKFYKNDSCGQKDMMEKSKRPRTENGRVVVNDFGCCEYISRAGRPIKKRTKEK